MIFALSFPVLLALGGFAIDLSSAMYHRAHMNSALDAAALSVTRMVVAGSLDAEDDELVQASAMRLFQANLAAFGMDAARVEVSNLDVRVLSEPGGVRTVGRYEANYAMWFGGLVGLDTLPLAAEVETRSAIPSYIDFYLALDVSQSMGLAATPDDVSLLKSKNWWVCFRLPRQSGWTRQLQYRPPAWRKATYRFSQERCNQCDRFC